MKNDNHIWDNKHPTAQMLGDSNLGIQDTKAFEETLKKQDSKYYGQRC